MACGVGWCEENCKDCENGEDATDCDETCEEQCEYCVRCMFDLDPCRSECMGKSRSAGFCYEHCVDCSAEDAECEPECSDCEACDTCWKDYPVAEEEADGEEADEMEEAVEMMLY